MPPLNIEFIVTKDGQHIAKDDYGGVLVFKTAEDVQWFLGANPFYNSYHRLQRAKVPRKKSKITLKIGKDFSLPIFLFFHFCYNGKICKEKGEVMVSNVIWLNWNGVTYGLQILSGLQVLPGSPIEKMAYLIKAESITTYRAPYTIIAHEDGRPKTCSCPHFTKAIDAQGTHPWCKHLQMAERWWRENTEAGKEAQRLIEQQAVAAGL